MMHGLMLAAAVEATEADVPESRVDDFGRSGSVVLGEVVGARAMTPGPLSIGAFGGVGSVGQVSAAWLSISNQEMNGTRYKTLTAQPSFDVFVADGVSLGALVGGGVTHIEDPNGVGYDAWEATMVPRVGHAFGITDGVSWWPRVGVGVTLFDQPQQEKLGTILRVTAVSPFVFRLARHVALEVGPNLMYADFLAGPADQRGLSVGVNGGLSIVF